MSYNTNLDYIPLNSQTIKSGMSFGPVEFKIKNQSHQHHIAYLKTENSGKIFNFSRDFLFPFEMFPLPRVLANSYKKINEISSVRCKRLIYDLPVPGETLLATTFVDSVFER